MSDEPAVTDVPLVPAALGLSPREVAAVLETAGLAPSVHNTQPWAFRVAPEVIELHADPARRLPARYGQGKPHERRADVKPPNTLRLVR